MNHISGKLEQLLALHKTLCKEYEKENKILKKEVADFKSGERFKQIQREHHKLVDEYRRQLKQLNLVIEGLHKDVKNAWKWCEEAYEDALKELRASMKEMKRALKEKEKKSQETAVKFQTIVSVPKEPVAQLCLPTMEERNRYRLRSFAFRHQKRWQKIRVLRRQIRLLSSSSFLLS